MKNVRGPLLYVASRASLPERPAMWRALRDEGWRILSTWIDEAKEGETTDYTELWERIENEIRRSDGLILYVEKEDFPLKGALIEVGMALAMHKPVAVVLAGPPFVEPGKLRPVGSWLMHSRCDTFSTVEESRAWIDSFSGTEATMLLTEFVDFLEPMRFDRASDDAMAADLDKRARQLLGLLP